MLVKRCTVALAAFSVVLGAASFAGSATVNAAPKPTPMPMKHHMGPVNVKMDKQVAPAVTAALMPSAIACGKKVSGSGSVKMIPVHVGKMGTAPHVDLVLKLHGAQSMHKYNIGGTFTGAHSWSGTAETVTTAMGGKLNTTTRLMPMLRAGHYTAKIWLTDNACGGMMHHPVAYQTPKSSIQLK